MSELVQYLIIFSVLFLIAGATLVAIYSDVTYSILGGILISVICVLLVICMIKQIIFGGGL